MMPRVRSAGSKQNGSVNIDAQLAEDASIQELLQVFGRIKDPEIRALAILMTREVAEAAEKLGFNGAPVN